MGPAYLPPAFPWDSPLPHCILPHYRTFTQTRYTRVRLHTATPDDICTADSTTFYLPLCLPALPRTRAALTPTARTHTHCHSGAGGRCDNVISTRYPCPWHSTPPRRAFALLPHRGFLATVRARTHGTDIYVYRSRRAIHTRAPLRLLTTLSRTAPRLLTLPACTRQAGGCSLDLTSRKKRTCLWAGNSRHLEPARLFCACLPLYLLPVQHGGM